MFRSLKGKLLLTIALFAILFSCSALAQVTAEMTANKIVTQGDKETREVADKAKPGDIVEYSVAYKNAGKHAVKNVLATLPVPIGMELLPQTPKPAEFTATVEGSTYAKLPLKRTVTGPDGKTKEVEIPIVEIRGIRWNLGELKAGETRVITARMRLQPVAVSEPAKSARN